MQNIQDPEGLWLWHIEIFALCWGCPRSFKTLFEFVVFCSKYKSNEWKSELKELGTKPTVLRLSRDIQKH